MVNYELHGNRLLFKLIPVQDVPGREKKREEHTKSGLVLPGEDSTVGIIGSPVKEDTVGYAKLIKKGDGPGVKDYIINDIYMLSALGRNSMNIQVIEYETYILTYPDEVVGHVIANEKENVK